MINRMKTRTFALVLLATLAFVTFASSQPTPFRFPELWVDGNITVGGTVDGRDVAADGSTLDGVGATAPTTDQKAALDAADSGGAGPSGGNPFVTLAEVGALGGGTVTSVAVSGTDGIEVDSGSPVTTAGTITLGSAKLLGIEALADVTDVTNVTAAGALMDSEVSNLSGIKTLTLPDSATISVFGASLTDDLNATAALATLGADAAGTARPPTTHAASHGSGQSDELNHDNLAGFVAAEHIDWSVTGAEQVHADRYSSGSGGATNTVAGSAGITNTGDNVNAVLTPTYGSTASTVTQGNDPRLSDARTPTAHNHVELDITDLGAYPDSTGQLTDLVAQTDGAGGWTFIATPAGGSATWGAITGTLSAQTDLQSALDGKSATGHAHSAADLTSGTLADVRVAASNVTQHVGVIDHDALLNYSAAEHIDWTADQGATNIDIGNVPPATTTAAGIVELATDGEAAANVCVQGDDSRLAAVALNSAVRLTTDEYNAVNQATTPSATNLFLTESDIGAIEDINSLITDGPVSAFITVANEAALPVPAIENRYAWATTEGTLWRQNGGGTWEAAGGGGTEANDLEATVASVLDNEVFVGTGPDAGTYLAIPATGTALSFNGTAFTQAALTDLSDVTAPTGTGEPVLATSPTIVTPTIVSFANATHDHADAAGGGALAAGAVTAHEAALSIAYSQVTGHVDADHTTIATAQSTADDHIADAADAHDASAISVVPGAVMTSTNAQSALEEIQIDATTGIAIANAALAKTGGQMSGNITMLGTETVDGRDVSVDGTKLDTIEQYAGLGFGQWTFETGTIAESAANSVRTDAATQTATTALRFDNLSLGGSPLGSALKAVRVGDKITMRDAANPADFASFIVNVLPTYEGTNDTEFSDVTVDEFTGSWSGNYGVAVEYLGSQSHALDSANHLSVTLAEFNTKISDQDVVGSDDPRLAVAQSTIYTAEFRVDPVNLGWALPLAKPLDPSATNYHINSYGYEGFNDTFSHGLGGAQTVLSTWLASLNLPGYGGWMMPRAGIVKKMMVGGYAVGGAVTLTYAIAKTVNVTSTQVGTAEGTRSLATGSYQTSELVPASANTFNAGDKIVPCFKTSTLAVGLYGVVTVAIEVEWTD